MYIYAQRLGSAQALQRIYGPIHEQMMLQITVIPMGKIRPHRRCWGVIFRMALVKGYRFTWGGGAFFGQNLLFLIGRDARLQKTL